MGSLELGAMMTQDMALGYLDYRHHVIGNAAELSAFARAEAGARGLRYGPVDPYLAAIAGVGVNW